MADTPTTDTPTTDTPTTGSPTGSPATASTAPAERPVPVTATASAYLSELHAAAELVLIRREQAELAEQASWLTVPNGIRRRTCNGGPGTALNGPLMHVDQYQYTRLMEAATSAQVDVGRVAWWYTTAALATLDAALAGQQITARRLEELSFGGVGRDRETRGVSSAWHPCYRPHLPREGELRTGIERIDEAMDHRLAPLLAAYAAAGAAEDVQEDEHDCDDEPRALSDHEAGALHDAEKRAATIPDLLIAYARTIEAAAHAAHATGRRRVST